MAHPFLEAGSWFISFRERVGGIKLEKGHDDRYLLDAAAEKATNEKEKEKDGNTASDSGRE